MEVSKLQTKEEFSLEAPKQGIGSTASKKENDFDREQEKLVDKLGAKKEGVDTVTEEDKKIAEISEEDLELAQQLIFKGFAEKDVKFGALDVTVTVVSTSANDVEMINDMVKDYIDFYDKDRKKDGEVAYETPVYNLESYRNTVMLALSISSVNGKDICEDNPQAKLQIIKSGIEKINKLNAVGDITKAEEMKEDIKKRVNYRARTIASYPIPVIDFFSRAKMEFDDKMMEVLSNEDVFPKS